MMRVVIDSNVLLQILPRTSPFRQIYDAILAEKLILILSNEIVFEYEEVIQKRISPEVAKNVLKLIENLPNSEYHEIFYRWNLIEKDFDDNKFSDTAINSAADYLITNDGHFKVLKSIPFPKVNVVSPKDFLKLLKP